MRDEKKIPAVLEWGKYKGDCYEGYNSQTKVCNKDDRCLIQLSSGHFCRCDYSRSSGYQDDLCEGTDLNPFGHECRQNFLAQFNLIFHFLRLCVGDLTCSTTSGHNCSKCPDGYYYDPVFDGSVQEPRCSPTRTRDSFLRKKTRVKYVVISIYFYPCYLQNFQT